MVSTQTMYKNKRILSFSLYFVEKFISFEVYVGHNVGPLTNIREVKFRV